MREGGRREGLAEGAAQEKRKIAKVMKDRKLSLDEIVEITGLLPEEIEKL